MRRTVLTFALALAACIGDSDVQNALDGYCAKSVSDPCTKTVDCCPGFECLGGTCERLIPGRCLFAADAGQRQALGAGCGCTSDCAEGTCTDLKCR